MIRTRLSPLELNAVLAQADRPRLIDVRNFDEFQIRHVSGFECVPLGQLLHQASEWPAKEPICLICNEGPRSERAADQLAAAGFQNIATVAGGTRACARADLPVIRERRGLPLQQQTLIGAGVVILTGLVGSLFYSPLIALSWFAGVMLIFAGVTGFCMMARILARAPWNRNTSVTAPNTWNATCDVRDSCSSVGLHS